LPNGAKNRRLNRLQAMLDDVEFRAIDAWRFKHLMPSRAAAIRDLIRRGLSTTNDPRAIADTFDRGVAAKTTDFGVIEVIDAGAQTRPRNRKRPSSRPSPIR
jgi:hypothetical protein